VEARTNLAIALVRAGRLEAAIAAGEEALRLAPDHTQARQNLERIRALRDAAARRE
jgi:Flp pilus assembly protein TadD